VTVLEYLTLYEFIVATLMALAGLCAFLWAAATGLWRNVEAAKYQVLEVEEERDGGA
jgi:cbb3-type cytochrome oxidase maturation protein